MGDKHSTVGLFTAQSSVVLQTLQREGVCFSKRAYVQQKYGESAPVFLTAYNWFAEAAQSIVPRPQGAELPYWCFADIHMVDACGAAAQVQALKVPKTEAIFFDVFDWNKILQLHFLGETPQEEQEFRAVLAQRGVREQDVLLTQFYPAEKQRILQSWQRLFRHHTAILAGDTTGVHSVQAAVWQLKKEWLGTPPSA